MATETGAPSSDEWLVALATVIAPCTSQGNVIDAGAARPAG